MPNHKEPPALETLCCENLLAVLYHLTVHHDHDVSQSAARRQHLLARVPPHIKQKLVASTAGSLNLDLNMTCKILDYALDGTTTGLDLCARAYSNFTFPVDQVVGVIT